jgi:hypothetical protein
LFRFQIMCIDTDDFEMELASRIKL